MTSDGSPPEERRQRTGPSASALFAGNLLLALVWMAMTGRFDLESFVLGFVFAWSVVIGSLFFIGLQHATRSVWSVVLRRCAEMLAASWIPPQSWT